MGERWEYTKKRWHYAWNPEGPLEFAEKVMPFIGTGLSIYSYWRIRHGQEGVAEEMNLFWSTVLPFLAGFSIFIIRWLYAPWALDRQRVAQAEEERARAKEREESLRAEIASEEDKLIKEIVEGYRHNLQVMSYNGWHNQRLALLLRSGVLRAEKLQDAWTRIRSAIEDHGQPDPFGDYWKEDGMFPFLRWIKARDLSLYNENECLSVWLTETPEPPTFPYASVREQLPAESSQQRDYRLRVSGGDFAGPPEHQDCPDGKADA